MAKVSDSELVSLIEEAIDRYVTSRRVDPGNVCKTVAAIIVQALHDAGTIVIRDERDQSTAAVARLRHVPT